MNNKFSIFILLLLIVTLVLPGVSAATVPATGEFTATKACQAYQSMRKKTNPDHTVLTVGQRYPVVEANVASGTTWYRITIQDASPRERWVYFSCGTADVTVAGSSQPSTPKPAVSCNVAGEEDSYVFAVSWQPAFCEGHSDKPECKVDDPNSYQAKNFTLHGLWPNKNSCGTNYGFCGEYKSAVRPFCDFNPVPMNANTLKELEGVMPSAAYGSCLQRHEWYKHGTCQTEWGADGYFEHAIHLLADFNGDPGQGMAAFMTANLGKRVDVAQLNETVDQLFGDGAHLRMQYSCNRDNKLQDIYINLPAKLSHNSLGYLIQQAAEGYRNKCGDSFIVDPIGQ